MELLEAIGNPAEYIVAIFVLLGFVWGGMKYIPKGYRWRLVLDIHQARRTRPLKHIEVKYETLRFDKPNTAAVPEAWNYKPQTVKVESDYRI